MSSRFEVRGTLGGGGTTEVLRAVDRRLDRSVALKRVPPELGDEAQLLARLEHPNIVRIYDVVAREGAQYLVMELVDGESLAALLHRTEATAPLPLARAIPILLGVTRALAHAHEHGVVHRDLKSENVLIGVDGSPKLIDFGLSSSQGDRDGNGEDPAPTELSGTLHSMSPEQSHGRQCDSRSDVFSLGALFYEVLSGRAPFAGVDAVATLRKVRELVPTPVHELREEIGTTLSALVARMIEKRPADRAPLTEVIHVLAQLSTTARSQHTVSPGVPRSRQLTLVVLSAVQDRSVRADADYEEWLALERRIRSAVGDVGGTVLYAAGSQIALCVGYPTAREDSSAEAAGIARLATTLGDAREPESASLRISAALDAGMLPVADADGRTVVMGRLVDALTLAASAGHPGQVRVGSGAAAVLARSYGLGPEQTLSLPSGPYVIREMGARLASGAHHHDGPLVARERQWAQLDSAWDAARRSVGTAALVVGEAGVGKSRLVSDWSRGLGLGLTDRRWSLRCTPNSRYESFSSLRELIVGDMLGLDEAADAEAVEAALQQLGIRERPWISAVQSILPGASVASSDAPRSTLLDHLAGMLLSIASTAPTLLVAEDVHWIDQSSWAVLKRVVERLGKRPLLVAMVSRPEFVAKLQGKEPTRIDVGRLEEQDATQLVQAVLTGRDVPARAVHEIVRYASGVPLLLEQLAYAVTRAPTGLHGAAELAAVPTSLRESVQRRLEGLGEGQRTLQSLALLGSGAPISLVCALAGASESLVNRNLREAVDLDLVHSGDRAEFKHALIRDATYDAMAEAERKAAHRKVVELLEGSFAPLLESRPELYAQHYVVAGEIQPAITLLTRAGSRARQSWSYEDACDHFKAARLLLVEHVDPSPERDRSEREVLRAHYPAATAVLGWADPEVKALLARGKELDAALGDRPALADLWGQWIMSLITHNLEGVQAAFAAIEAAGDSVEVRFLHDVSMGVTHYHRGELDRAAERLSRARETVVGSLSGRLSSEETLDLSAASAWSEEVLSSASLYLAVVETCRGAFSAAETFQLEAEKIADRLGSPYAMSFCVGSRTVHALIRGEPSFVEPTLARLEELCAGDADWLAYGRAQLGMAQAMRTVAAGGDAAEAADLFARSFGIFGAMGFVVSSELQAAACADLYRQAGQYDEAQKHLDAAMAIADHELARIYAAHVYLAGAKLERSKGNGADAATWAKRARGALAAVRCSDVPARQLTHHLDAFDDPERSAFSPS